MLRFWSKVSRPTPDGCWEWLASKDNKGYGHYGLGGKTIRAHIIAYREYFGQVPAGKEIDHLCSNRRCVNPAHLEAVTHLENVRRGKRVKTTCPAGHPYAIYGRPIKGKGGRYCSVCKRDRAK